MLADLIKFEEIPFSLQIVFAEIWSVSSRCNFTFSVKNCLRKITHLHKSDNFEIDSLPLCFLSPKFKTVQVKSAKTAEVRLSSRSSAVLELGSICWKHHSLGPHQSLSNTVIEDFFKTSWRIVLEQFFNYYIKLKNGSKVWQSYLEVKLFFKITCNKK